MKTYLALMKIDLKLALRMRTVIFFNYLFPLMFFFIFATMFHAREYVQMIYKVLSMVITLGLLGNGLFGAGLRAIQEREMNILRRYKVTPITPAPLLVASMVTAWFVFMPYILIVLAISHFRYHMPWPSHFGSLLVFISLGLVAFRSLGLVIASVANSMQEGQILIQLLYFPMMFLSGATVPAEVFPKFLLVVSNFIPATYMVKGIQAILVDNKGLGSELDLVAIMIVVAAVGLTVGMKLFRWEKEEKIRTSAKLWVAAVLLPFVLLGIWLYTHGKGMAPTQWPQEKGTGSLHRDNGADHRPGAS